MKKLLSIIMLIFVLTSLVSCNNELPPDVQPPKSDTTVTEPPVTDATETELSETEPPVTDAPETDPPETEQPMVYEYTPSLASKDEIKEIGVRMGDVIVDLLCFAPNGMIYSELGPGCEILFDSYLFESDIERVPVVKYSPDMEIYNNMGYGQLHDIVYLHFDPGNPLGPLYRPVDHGISFNGEPGVYSVVIGWSYRASEDTSNPTWEELVGRKECYMSCMFIMVVE